MTESLQRVSMCARVLVSGIPTPPATTFSFSIKSLANFLVGIAVYM